ncbi:MAG: hypothetical protein WBB69_11120 [Anaerolineales bacterium]
MKKLINPNLAGQILIGAFLLMLIMHFLILFQLLPSSFIWGGRVSEDGSNLVQLESVAILVTMLFIGITALKMREIRAGSSKTWINIGTWLIFAYLVLNTLGNFASGVSLETLFFGPLTILMALCALRLVIEI